MARWRDVHPGRRFLRALDALDSTGPLVDESDFENFVDNIAARFEWPTIGSLASRGSKLKTLENPIMETFVDCCRSRLRNPATYVFLSKLFADAEPSVRWGDLGIFPPAIRVNGMAQILREGGQGLVAAHDIYSIVRQFAFGSTFDFEGSLISTTSGDRANSDFIETLIGFRVENIVGLGGWCFSRVAAPAGRTGAGE